MYLAEDYTNRQDWTHGVISSKQTGEGASISLQKLTQGYTITAAALEIGGAQADTRHDTNTNLFDLGFDDPAMRKSQGNRI